MVMMFFVMDSCWRSCEATWYRWAWDRCLQEHFVRASNSLLRASAFLSTASSSTMVQFDTIRYNTIQYNTMSISRALWCLRWVGTEALGEVTLCPKSQRQLWTVRFLPRCMECRRGLTMTILSVRPSVCHTRDLWQNGRKICPNFYTIRKSFLRRRMVGRGRPLLPEILGQPTPVGAKSPILNR